MGEFEATIQDNVTSIHTKLDGLEEKLATIINELRELQYIPDAAVRTRSVRVNNLEFEGQQGNGKELTEIRRTGLSSKT